MKVLKERAWVPIMTWIAAQVTKQQAHALFLPPEARALCHNKSNMPLDGGTE